MEENSIFIILNSEKTYLFPQRETLSLLSNPVHSTNILWRQSPTKAVSVSAYKTWRNASNFSNTPKPSFLLLRAHIYSRRLLITSYSILNEMNFKWSSQTLIFYYFHLLSISEIPGCSPPMSSKRLALISPNWPKSPLPRFQLETKDWGSQEFVSWQDSAMLKVKTQEITMKSFFFFSLNNL